MATAGVDIASATVAEEVIAAAAAPWPIAAALRVAVGQQAVVVRSTAARGLTMLVGCTPAQPARRLHSIQLAANPTLRLRIAPVAADRAVVVVVHAVVAAADRAVVVVVHAVVAAADRTVAAAADVGSPINIGSSD
jgi:hypothetical protein